MYRALGAAALLSIAIAAPVQDAAAQDPVGGAILGGAAGAILGGALRGGRGAAVGAIVGGVTGAAIAAQGQPRPGGYRYYRQGGGYARDGYARRGYARGSARGGSGAADLCNGPSPGPTHWPLRRTPQ